MKVKRKIKNNIKFPKISKVDYIILHATNGPLNKVINIFKENTGRLSCHYIIDENGEVYQLLKVSKEETQMGWHAGRSLLKLPDDKIISEFNNFSIGIELINRNGNLYPYSNKLYESLVKLVQHLIQLFPNLKDPNRILGHEHISGFRGKVDPGHMFDWNLFYKKCYGTIDFPIRKPQMPLQFKELLSDIQSMSDEHGTEQAKTNTLIKRLMSYYIVNQEDKISSKLNS